MPTKVVEAMARAAAYSVDIIELQEKAGAAIAQMLGSEAALVTSGASAGLVLAATACMTGTDTTCVEQLPNTTGLKHEVIILKGQRNRYDGALQIAGVRFREVGASDSVDVGDVEAAITDRTAAVVFFPTMPGSDLISLSTLAKAAHRHGLPVIVDAASMVPPMANLRRCFADGADLVSISGGKAFRGPQSTGILCGRRDLVDAARLNMLSFLGRREGVGRPMKVSKEEVIGLVAALELLQETGEKQPQAAWRAMVETIRRAVDPAPGLRAVIVEPGGSGYVPKLRFEFSDSWGGPSAETVARRLMQGDPPIQLALLQDGALGVFPGNLEPGQEHLVARRLREALSGSRHS